MLETRLHHWLLACTLALITHITLGIVFIEPSKMQTPIPASSEFEIQLDTMLNSSATQSEKDGNPATGTDAVATSREPSQASRKPKMPEQSVRDKADAEAVARASNTEKTIAPVPPSPSSKAATTKQEQIERPVNTDSDSRTQTSTSAAKPRQLIDSTSIAEQGAADTDAYTAKASAQQSKPALTETEQVGQAADANAKADYFARLSAWFEQHRQYPRSARLRRQEGTVLLYFTIDGQGKLLEYRIERSSGVQALDQEVRDMLKRASPFPAPPVGDIKPLEFLLPIQFILS